MAVSTPPAPASRRPAASGAAAAQFTRAAATISGGAANQRRAHALHQPRRGEPTPAHERGRRWATIGFMVVIHALAVVALLPR
ncbi:MAG: acyl-CoA desaturase, partial [Prochlorococcaceae cyanobacterium]